MADVVLGCAMGLAAIAATAVHYQKVVKSDSTAFACFAANNRKDSLHAVCRGHQRFSITVSQHSCSGEKTERSYEARAWMFYTCELEVTKLPRCGHDQQTMQAIQSSGREMVTTRQTFLQTKWRRLRPRSS